MATQDTTDSSKPSDSGNGQNQNSNTQEPSNQLPINQTPPAKPSETTTLRFGERADGDKLIEFIQSDTTDDG